MQKRNKLVMRQHNDEIEHVIMRYYVALTVVMALTYVVKMGTFNEQKMMIY